MAGWSMNRRHFVAAATATMAAPAIGRAQEVLRSAKANLRLVTLSRGLVQPWSMAFLPDGRMLITERPGRLRVFANGRLEPTPLAGVAQNRTVYLSYVANGAGGPVTTVARAELGDGGLRGVTPIFAALPHRPGSLNMGSRIVFDRAGLMYVSCGDRFQMELAQNLKDLAGKIVRLRDDGSVPPDNPFVGRSDARPEIFTWGNRN